MQAKKNYLSFFVQIFLWKSMILPLKNDGFKVWSLGVKNANGLISQVATRNVKVGWEFKLPFDADFVER
jgi:hypothetical protein